MLPYTGQTISPEVRIVKDFVYLVVIVGTLLVFLYWSFREARRNDERDVLIEDLRAKLQEKTEHAERQWHDLRKKSVALRCAAMIGKHLQQGRSGEAKFLWDMSHGLTIRSAIGDHDGPDVFGVRWSDASGKKCCAVVVANDIEQAAETLGISNEASKAARFVILGPCVPPFIAPHVACREVE